jgi:hypothetical protein
VAKPLADIAHPVPHPTVREFAELLEQWGFKPLHARRTDRHHRLLRGPHGGRIQVLASLQGRADADQLARAAHLAQVDLDTFLAGPSARPSGRPDPASITGNATAAAPQPSAKSTARPPRPRAGGDSVVALVLTTHARQDRPMRFEELVDLCDGRVTRVQVREASAHLCRTGQLDRICDGVYQWAHGARRQASSHPAPAQPPTIPPQAAGTEPIRSQATVEPVDELFARLFPDGVRMTPQLLRDLQQWTELTRALATHVDNP